MLVLFIIGVIVSFCLGFFFAALLANERRAEDLEDFRHRLENLKNELDISRIGEGSGSHGKTD